MTTPHPDSYKLIAAAKEYDEAQGAREAPDGTKAGVDSFALLGIAGYRAKIMFEGFGPLRKTLTPAQADEVLQLMTWMWQDGFTMRATYDRMHNTEEK